MSFPPVDLGLLSVVALVPLAIQFRFASARSLLLSSASFGLVFFGALLYWIGLFGLAAFAGLVVVQSLWMVVALQLGRGLRNHMVAGKTFALVPAFVLGEYVRSYLPWSGFAWGGLGYALHDYLPALRLAPYTGVWGLSLAVLLVNCLLAESVVRGRGGGWFSAWAAGGAALVMLAPVLLPTGTADGPRATVALVQGNVPEGTSDPREDDDIVVANQVRMTQALQPNPDLVLWPEGAFDRDPRDHGPYSRILAETVRRTNAPFVVGAITRGPEGPRNSSLFIEADGEVAGVYHKQRLVPFGEWVPLRSFLQPLFSELDRVPVDLVPGQNPAVFAIPSGRLASIICYESTYPDLVRAFVHNGARLLTVSSNFSSYDRTAASEQHLAFSQMRAAEHRMWLAHAAISGQSAVVDPSGQIVDKTGLFEPAILEPQLRFATEVTPYARLGDWIVALTALAPVVPLVRSRRRSRTGRSGLTAYEGRR